MRVVVLMSTYNGERYVQEQVASILKQLPAEGRLIVRDDGSRDTTPDVVARIHDPRVTLIRGENQGFVRSFLGLIASAPTDAEMVMLSDQDDVWLADKIERAWHVIAAAGSVPTLYCSRLQLVDSTLQPIGLSPLWPRAPSFTNALTENIVTGCTAALNPAALTLLRDNGDPGKIFFHDWWLYLVVGAFGRVVFDPKPTVLYRQHGTNIIGMSDGVARYVNVLRFLRRHDWVQIMFNQIDNFREVHGMRLEPGQRLMLASDFDRRKGRSLARLLLAPRLRRQTVVSELLFRALVAAGLLTGRAARSQRAPSECG